jgi:hypothetical protein
LHVPGIGSITFDRLSTHASATCDGAAFNFSAMFESTEPGLASEPAASGNDAELIGLWHLRIDAMKLPQIDALHSEPAHAHEHALPQIFGTTERQPNVRTVPREPALRRDQHIFVRMQRLANEIFADERSIRVGGVDEVDAELGELLERRFRRIQIGWRSPNASAGDAHRAEAETMYSRFTGDFERAGGFCGDGGRHGRTR